MLQLADADAAPTVRDVERVLEALKRLLVRELSRRGILDSSPSYLGVVGESWAEGGGPGALSELAEECFTYTFVERLQTLRAQAQVKPDVEGLVRLNVRHFVYERQRRSDPLGARVYLAFKGAVESAIESGRLFRLSGAGSLSNENVLAFRVQALTVADGEYIREQVRLWSPKLLPALVVASGRAWTALLGRLVELICALEGEGVEAFRVGDALREFKSSVRAHWATIVAAELGATDAGEVRVETEESVLPALGFEDRQAFEALRREVRAALGELDVDEKTRAYLRDLWSFLADSAASPDREASLSQRRMARDAGVPRGRLPELLAVLADLVSRVRSQPISRRGPLAMDGDE